MRFYKINPPDYFSLGENSSDAAKLKNIAAETPAAAAVSPPVSMPDMPRTPICSFTPVQSRYPNPGNGTVAPAPAQFAKGSYIPSAPSTQPNTTNITNILAGVNFVLSIKTCPIAHISPPAINALRYCIQTPLVLSNITIVFANYTQLYRHKYSIRKIGQIGIIAQ